MQNFGTFAKSIFSFSSCFGVRKKGKERKITLKIYIKVKKKQYVCFDNTHVSVCMCHIWYQNDLNKNWMQNVQVDLSKMKYYSINLNLLFFSFSSLGQN